MNIQEKYSPIYCGFHDYLEHYATRKQYIQIQYFDSINAFRNTHSIIKHIYSIKGEEFLELVSGEKIRLDKLISVNGHQNPVHGFDDLSCECD